MHYIYIQNLLVFFVDYFHFYSKLKAHMDIKHHEQNFHLMYVK